MTQLTTSTKEAQQIQLEQEMRDAGITRYRNLVAESTGERLETATSAGLKLLKTAIEPLIQKIKDHMEDDGQTRRGPKSISSKYLPMLEPEVIAFITAKTVFNAITYRNPYANTAMRVANALEDEVRLRYFRGVNPNFYQTVFGRIRNKNSYEYKRTVLIHSMGKTGIDWEPWPAADKMHLGSLCIDLLIESTHFVENIEIPKGKNQTVYYLIPTQETLRWLEEEHQNNELLTPTFLPMVVKPKDWTTPFDGGYIGDLAGRLKLVKTHNPNYLDELASIEMPEVYQALNHIQGTAWRINNPVMNVVETFWQQDLDIAGLPPREDRTPRPCPLPRDLKPALMDKDQFNTFMDWKREAANVYEQNIINRSKRLLFSKILYVAHKYAQEPEIYFPHALDFRGRVYALPNFLNPQGNDMAKGLLTFAHGKPIENETAARWLAIHGANLYGHDKVGFDERVAFIAAMADTIQRIANDPLTHQEWAEADKPWQFLAFCFEWAEFTQQGYGFVSHLPIALDGSCNGLQHFSAMLRDEVGGAAVNLLPSDKPEDIYQRVADVTIQKLKAEATSNSDHALLATQWLSFGVDRKITKRPVMILPYGGSRQACREYIENTIRERLSQGEINPFSDDERDNIFHASVYLAGVVWESIGEVVIAARHAMDWLRAAARLISDEGLPVTWTSPSGFRVFQAYYEVKSRRIKTQLSGNVIRKIYLNLQEATNNLDKREQTNGISPNFIHSMDAAALHLYVNLAKEKGIESCQLIHDSYGTLAADTAISAECIREVFIQIYQRDILSDFREDLLEQLSTKNARKLAPIPPKGNLDLEAVRHSAFFFA
ncbi:MAG: DNA-directed RNA polymerase [Candidatus Melainabacteria bacterium]|nr:DNA-directed RNA polymerase [Candidatus Melainabacteria bacterium]